MDSSIISSFGWLLTAGVIALIVFLIGRQFVLWYFRLGQIADDLHVIAQHYRQMDSTAERQRIEQGKQAAHTFATARNAVG